MPENGVVNKLHQEILKKSGEDGESSKKSADDESEYGTFVVHQPCVALTTGKRQTVVFHQAPDDDRHFLPLPFPKSKQTDKCSTCQAPESTTNLLEVACSRDIRSHYATHKLSRKTTAEIVNLLQPRGRLFSAVRGKEIAIGIGEYAFRICFGTEGHCLWILTAHYNSIVGGQLSNRGEKGKAFQVPPNLIFGPPRNTPLQITIQAAFIRPDWTLIFVDHQVFITFHVMRLRQPCSANDFAQCSPLWHRLWSAQHGPVYSSEPEKTLAVLDAFRNEVQESSLDYTPVWKVMKERQDVFNGFGAQESCDTLFEALIHPKMPVSYVCKHDEVWRRFHKAVIQDHLQRIASLKTAKLPCVSGRRKFPFSMNVDGHNRYLHTITCYRRNPVSFSVEKLTQAHALGLFNPDAVLGEDGVALTSTVGTV
ncbi:fatty acid synthase alpha subunit Lsd1 [Paramarasmius palmivorus]|uniref:Fatty acid synthase alpha subunit Lsd1 n=1 Tax=Paramarasmius palmivorus TaxID=297713 RepID=A0AAW0CRQ1_9AGAR